MPRLLRVSQVVAETGLKERTVRKLIATNRLAVVRPVGMRVVLIPAWAVAALTGRAMPPR